jgi:hypothetical protein
MLNHSLSSRETINHRVSISNYPHEVDLFLLARKYVWLTICTISDMFTRLKSKLDILFYSERSPAVGLIAGNENLALLDAAHLHSKRLPAPFLVNLSLM